jgi:hypothetical protein
MLPSKVYQEEEFDLQCKLFSNRFNIESPTCIFPKRGEDETNIPIDGLNMYINQTWDVIKD